MALSHELGTEKISKLLIQQAAPASIGFLIMSLYNIVDTIYVGRFIGPMAIAAVTVVMPISYMISSIGMAIGVGGASVISRALGRKNKPKALRTFGNQINLTLHLAVAFVILGFWFDEETLTLFGGKGEILPYAREYFHVLLLGIPFLAWAMMSNNVIRAQGRAKTAMYIMIVPAVINIILDPIFIIALKMGLKGAAWATVISYMLSATYALVFFLKGNSEIKIIIKYFKLKWDLVKEIFSIGVITLARQGSVSVLIVVLNHTLYAYMGEIGIAVYGVVNRVMMFALFPVIGILQGFLPIAGYNYGAKLYKRVRASIYTSIKYSVIIAAALLLLIAFFSKYIVSAFTKDPELTSLSARALTIVFSTSPIITVQLIGSGYFQALGKAVPALLLTLTKQGLFLIPLVLILPPLFGTDGIWFSFPLSDILSSGVTWYFLKRDIGKRLVPHIKQKS